MVVERTWAVEAAMGGPWWGARAAVIGVALSCSAPEPEPARADHFSAFPTAVLAVAVGDVPGTVAAARGLRGGAIPDDEAASVGAAAGFLLVADAEERVDALLGVARACRPCHAGAAPAPSPTHEGVAEAAVGEVVFQTERSAPVVADGPWRAPLDRAWAGSVAPEERARAVLAACAACHPAGLGGG